MDESGRAGPLHQMFNVFTADAAKLVDAAHKIARFGPFNWANKLQARIITKRFISFMPSTSLAVSVSDPVSAMVIAALNFLSTPAGQAIVIDLTTGLKSVVVDLVNHIHGQLPAPAPGPVKA